MKLLKHAVLGLAAMSLASVASAQTKKIYITGSSAFRTYAHNAITHLMTPGFTYGYTGSGGLGKANSAIFVGQFNGESVIIKTTWTGSANGVQTVASSTNAFSVKFLPDSPSAELTTSGTAGLDDPTATGKANEPAVPDMAFSDVYQASTPFRGVFNGQSYDSLHDENVGVVSFQWVKSRGANSRITNMTPLLAQAQWIGQGKCPLALYSGLASDEGTVVYATGRDGDSGTRISAFAETGIGNTTTVQQWDCATEQLYLPQTVNGIEFGTGEGGEKSGGDLAGANKMGKTGLQKSYVSYMSTGDASTLKTTNGGDTLTYNGVAYSLEGVKEGQYTFWSYEHLLYKSGLTGTSLDFAESLVNQLTTVDASPLLGDMHVTREVDGGVITAEYGF